MSQMEKHFITLCYIYFNVSIVFYYSLVEFGKLVWPFGRKHNLRLLWNQFNELFFLANRLFKTNCSVTLKKDHNTPNVTQSVILLCWQMFHTLRVCGRIWFQLGSWDSFKISIQKNWNTCGFGVWEHKIPIKSQCGVGICLNFHFSLSYMRQITTMRSNSHRARCTLVLKSLTASGGEIYILISPFRSDEGRDPGKARWSVLCNTLDSFVNVL